MMNIRYIINEVDGHTDKERLMFDDLGNQVWAVVECGLEKADAPADAPIEWIEEIKAIP